MQHLTNPLENSSGTEQWARVLPDSCPPSIGDLRTGSVRNLIADLYAVMLYEIHHPRYEEAERARCNDPIYCYGRYLNPRTRQYAVHNVLSNVSAAIEYLNYAFVKATSRLDDLLKKSLSLSFTYILGASRGVRLASDRCPA